VATRSRRTCLPPPTGISRAARPSAVPTAARVRTDWTAPPMSPRPPEASRCTSSRRRL